MTIWNVGGTLRTPSATLHALLLSAEPANSRIVGYTEVIPKPRPRKQSKQTVTALGSGNRKLTQAQMARQARRYEPDGTLRSRKHPDALIQIPRRNKP